MKHFYKTGITIIELLIVLAVLGLIFLTVIPQFSKLKEDEVLQSSVGDILSSISKAQSETLASASSSNYGVHFQSGEIVIFKGTAYSSGNSNNETINISSPASISNVTFGGVSSTSGDMYFNKHYGTPSTTGTVTVSTASFSKVITISATGVASSN